MYPFYNNHLPTSVEDSNNKVAPDKIHNIQEVETHKQAITPKL